MIRGELDVHLAIKNGKSMVSEQTSFISTDLLVTI